MRVNGWQQHKTPEGVHYSPEAYNQDRGASAWVARRSPVPEWKCWELLVDGRLVRTFPKLAQAIEWAREVDRDSTVALTVDQVAEATAAADGLLGFWDVARRLGATERQADALERAWGRR